MLRHRTACLAGHVALQLDLPGGVRRQGYKLYKLTVEDGLSPLSVHAQHHPA
ncbi:MAG: hypothetical protein LLG00_09190 [Planctomycetaceae bacterium]|nr:hypothetical protein [Planctomycetaceae bacterium]